MTKVPQLFPNILERQLEKQFVPLCQEPSAELVEELKEQVTLHLAHVRGALQNNEFIDILLAKQIAETLLGLLSDLDAVPVSRRRLVVGAARYFVRTNDAQSDLTSILGFDDDLAVLNYVVESIGRKELRIEP